MSREDPHFRLRFPADLRKKVEAAAHENHRSMTAEIIARLEWSFDTVQVTHAGKTEPVSADDYRMMIGALIDQAGRKHDELRDEIEKLRASIARKRKADSTL